MSRGDRYLSHASECLRLARQVDNRADEESLRQMAESWKRLADQAGRGAEPTPEKSQPARAASPIAAPRRSK